MPYYKSIKENIKDKLGIEQDLVIEFVPLMWLPTKFIRKFEGMQTKDADVVSDDQMDTLYEILGNSVISWEGVIGEDGEPMPPPMRLFKDGEIKRLEELPFQILNGLMEAITVDESIPFQKGNDSSDRQSEDSQAISQVAPVDIRPSQTGLPSET